MALFATIVLSLPAAPAAAAAPAEHRFWDLGDLPGGASISYSYGLSSRGDVIAGESFSSGSSVHGEGVRWSRTSQTGWEMTGIGFPSSDALNTPAASATANGHWIVGRASFGPPTAPAIDTDAYRWSPSTGFERLGLPPGSVLVAALDANVNGDVIVGYAGPSASYADIRALVWTKSGQGFDVAFLETAYRSQAERVDPDGRIAIGWGASPEAVAAAAAAGGAWDPREAALWRREPSGTVARTWLGASPATVFQSQAHGLCRIRSKTFVVGTSGDFVLGELPVAWTVGAGAPAIEVLPLLPGFSSGAATAVSKSARRIVGTCWTPDFEFETCVWDLDAATDAYVASSLKARLAANGVASADGWTLWSAAGISDDGSILCGSGTDPLFQDRAWAAELP